MDVDKLEAGRELDALVAEKLGLPLLDGNPTGNPMLGSGLPVKYSTSISAAWEVVEKLCQHDKFISLSRGSWNQQTNTWTTWVIEVDGEKSTERLEAPTAPLAICRAALKAVSG